LRRCGSSRLPFRLNSGAHSHFLTRTEWHHGNLSYIRYFSCYLVKSIYLQSWFWGFCERQPTWSLRLPVAE
jgi:hypothetical protein